jgi:hypothetical protein
MGAMGGRLPLFPYWERHFQGLYRIEQSRTVFGDGPSPDGGRRHQLTGFGFGGRQELGPPIVGFLFEPGRRLAGHLGPVAGVLDEPGRVLLGLGQRLLGLRHQGLGPIQGALLLPGRLRSGGPGAERVDDA